MDLDEPVTFSRAAEREAGRYARWRARFQADDRFVLPRAVFTVASLLSLVAGCALLFWGHTAGGASLVGGGVALEVLRLLGRAMFRGPRDRAP